MPLTKPLKLIAYALAIIAAYAGGIGFVFLFVAAPSLIDIVSACKVVSLLALIYANREIPKNIELERHADISALNLAIVLASVLLMVLMVIKIVVDDYAMLTLAPTGQAVLGWFSANAYWASTLPVFGCFLLDLYIAYVRRGCPGDREIAAEFVMFRDLVCAVPLALVLLLAEAYSGWSPVEGARAAAELFFGGALAVILLASAIATRALNLSQTARRTAREAERIAIGAPPRLLAEAR